MAWISPRPTHSFRTAYPHGRRQHRHWQQRVRFRRHIRATNCFFGNGHGLSIGSYTWGGVSNLTVVSCTFSNTGNGIKVKSQRRTRWRGSKSELLQHRDDLTVAWPLQFYSYYEYGLGTLTRPLDSRIRGQRRHQYAPRQQPADLSQHHHQQSPTANIPNGRPILFLDLGIAGLSDLEHRLQSRSSQFQFHQ